MKKTLKLMGLCALAALALAGCKKNEQNGNMTFKAIISQLNSDAKTEIGAGNWLVWSEGDQIKVYTADKTEANAANFTLATGAGTKDATFSGTLAESNPNLYYAFYPTTGVELTSEGKFKLPVSGTQTFVDANFTTNTFPMCATTTDGDFEFHSPYGILGIPMKGTATIGSIVLTDSLGMNLVGYYEMNDVDTTFVGNSAAITLNFGEGLTLSADTAKTAYFIVPAGVFTMGFKAEVKGTDGNTITELKANNPNIILKENIRLMPEVTGVNGSTPPAPYDPLAVPLTLEAITDGTIVVKFPKAGMQYTLNGGAKTVINENTTINVSVGDKVQFYGNGTSITSYSYTTINHPSSTAKVIAYGNIMSLVDEDNFPTAKTLTSDNAFNHLFNTSLTDDNTSLTDASGLLLPATTLSPNCYTSLFNRCTALTAAPELPAPTMAERCYSYMFFNCTALTVAPELPSTNLAVACYDGMFMNCDHLLAAPELPATTLANECYSSMFAGCFGLTTATELPATDLAYQCYFMMFNSTALTVAPELPATTLAEKCYYGMFQGCHNLTVAPELPAPTLPNYCYTHMFADCSSLNSITCLATSGINQGTPYTNTEDWVNGVATSGIFIADPNATWPTGNNGIPTNWIRKNPDGSDWVEVPTGAVSGLFSVSATQQVYFSQGNLRAYNATANSTSGWVWSFAENQWDYIGTSGSNQHINGSMTISQPGYVDLFCWVGASASHDNYGIIYDNDQNMSWAHEATNFGNSTNDALKHDWGHNPITNGGNVADMWRTPTNDEWAYLINSRTTAAGTAPTINGTADARYAKAKLFGTNRGLIIFPDTYVHPDGVAYPTGINAEGNTSWNGNQYSAADWAKMEEAGCVFLPCAGIRVYYTQIQDIETRGFYASSTPRPEAWNQAKVMQFLNGSCVPNANRYRRDAGPVRLVKDAE